MIQRRDFFKKFLQHMTVYLDDSNGQQKFKITDLWDYDRETFKQVRFRVKDDTFIEDGGSDIVAVTEDGRGMVLCQKETTEEIVFRLFQQEITVGEVADQLVLKEIPGIADAFLFARDFILTQVKKSIFVPANEIQPKESLNSD